MEKFFVNLPGYDGSSKGVGSEVQLMFGTDWENGPRGAWQLPKNINQGQETTASIHSTSPMLSVA